MLPQPPLCTSTVFFCFPSSSSSSSSSYSSFFLPAPQRPNTYFGGQTRRKEEIDVSAREAQQTKERTRKNERRTLLHRQRAKNPPRRRFRPRSSTGAVHPLTVHRFVVVFFFAFEDAPAHQNSLFRISPLRPIFFLAQQNMQKEMMEEEELPPLAVPLSESSSESLKQPDEEKSAVHASQGREEAEEDRRSWLFGSAASLREEEDTVGITMITGYLGAGKTTVSLSCSSVSDL
jgi:hypothetical protein